MCGINRSLGRLRRCPGLPTKAKPVVGKLVPASVSSQDLKTKRASASALEINYKMLQTRIAKIAGLAVGATVAFGAFVPMAGAVTVAELQAQINALMAQLSSLQGATAPAATAAITSDLTVGASGAQVTALQQSLVAGGHLVMPAGAAYGYFGSLTKSAVMKWQAANGIPATGYFGPMSRAKYNVSAPATTTTTPTATISTTGVEGTITVSVNPTPSAAKLYENEDRKAVAGIKLEAKTSDIKIERIKLDLDHVTGTTVNDTNVYRKIAGKLYVMDGSTVVGSVDLNSTTVVKDGTDYFVTVSGMSFVVPKDSTKVLTVALDAMSQWDTDYDTETWSIGVPVEGVRGVDGAGVNQYGPSTAFSRSFTTQGDVVDDATIAISTNSSTPADQEVLCTSGADEDECDDLELLRLNLKAEKDDVKVTDLVVNVQKTGAGAASTTVARLYEGSTAIGSATVTNFSGSTSVTFSDIDYVVAKDSTKTLSLKIDVTDANGSISTFSASSTASNVTSENTSGTSLTATGSALGESITVRNKGLEFTLVSKAIKRIEPAGYAGATSSLQADFKVRLTARGSDVEFGDTASTTYPFAENDGTLTAANSFIVYAGGSASAPVVASSTSLVIGTGTSAAGGANSWVLSEGNSVDIDVTYVMQSKTTSYADITSSAYAVGLERLNWLTLSGGRQTSTFMSGNSAWRTGTVVLP